MLELSQTFPAVPDTSDLAAKPLQNHDGYVVVSVSAIAILFYVDSLLLLAFLTQPVRAGHRSKKTNPQLHLC